MNDVKGIVRLYACGGAATNIADAITKQGALSAPGFAELELAVVDGSDSNVKYSDIPPEQIHLVDGLDGSGGHRAENAAILAERKLEILQKFKPADLNIVMSSGGGGTGSVLAPVLTGELINRNSPVIVFIIGSVETRTDANNTLKTMMSYEAIAKRAGIPLVVYYVQNGNGIKQADVNAQVISTITTLRALYSRQNHGMDTMDLVNWLRFDKVTTYTRTKLAALTLVDRKGDITKVKDVIAVATLAKDPDSAAIPIFPEYQPKGYIQGNNQFDDLPLHFVITDDFLADRIKKIEDLMNDHDGQSSARAPKKNLFTREGKEGPSDLVL